MSGGAVVGTTTHACPGLREAADRFIDLALAQGASLAIDLNVRAHMWKDRRAMRAAIAALVARASLVKASDADLAAVEGVGDTRAKEIREGIRRLQEVDIVDRYR